MVPFYIHGRKIRFRLAASLPCAGPFVVPSFGFLALGDVTDNFLDDSDDSAGFIFAGETMRGGVYQSAVLVSAMASQGSTRSTRRMRSRMPASSLWRFGGKTAATGLLIISAPL